MRFLGAMNPITIQSMRLLAVKMKTSIHFRDPSQHSKEVSPPPRLQRNHNVLRDFDFQVYIPKFEGKNGAR